jgi:hypothetical protein
VAPRLTLLYQNTRILRRDYYAELFGPWIDKVIDDGSHTLVLDNCILSDDFVQRKDPEYYRQFRGLNAFLLLGPDEYYLAPALIYRNFRGVIRSHYSGAFLAKRVKQIPVGYNPGFEGLDPLKPANERSYLWSFQGEVNKSTRPDCIANLAGIGPNYWLATDNWQLGGQPLETDPTLLRKPRAAMYAILAESAFAPCPMGNVSQEAPRVYEALQVGAIPVLEKRRFMDVHRRLLGEHPLPTFYDWKHAADFMARLRQSPQDLNALQQQCVGWWAAYKTRLSAEIGDFLRRLQEEVPDENDPFTAFWARIPGWSVFELSRHHSPRALMRRVRRHAVRFATAGKLLVRH